MRFLIAAVLIGILTLIFPGTSGLSSPDSLGCHNFDKINDEKLVKNILQQLWIALGDGRRPLPEVRIIENETIASYMFVNGKDYIEFDPRALQICKAMGTQASSAIAFILGHELTHLYRSHHSSGFLPRQRSFKKYLPDEQEADLYGAFFAGVAGFEVEETVETLLNNIYATFPRKVTSNYPPLKDRIATAHERCKLAYELRQAFKMGVVLNSIEAYEAAIICFEYVNQSIRFQENFLNLGTAYLNLALGKRNEPDTALDYPLFASLETPFRGEGTTDLSLEQLLENAELFLDRALTYSPNDPSSIINKFAVYDLQEKQSLAFNCIRQLSSPNGKLSTKQEIALLLLKGISAFRVNPQSVEAKEAFNTVAVDSKAPASFRLIAENNLRVIAGKTKKMPTRKDRFCEDQIDNFSILSPTRPQPVIDIQLDDKGSQRFTICPFPNSTLLNLRLKREDFLVHLTELPTPVTSQGLGLGTPLAKIQEIYQHLIKYGPEDRMGSWVIIPSACLIFRLDTVNRVQEWGLFWTG